MARTVFKPRDRVRILQGPHAGKTGIFTGTHGGRGFAGYICVSLDEREWDAPNIALPGANVERVSS